MSPALQVCVSLQDHRGCHNEEENLQPVRAQFLKEQIWSRRVYISKHVLTGDWQAQICRDQQLKPGQ